MSRQLELVQEERQTKRRDALVRALEYELPGVLETQGIIFYGFSMNYDAYDCLMVLKAEFDNKRQVAFVGGGSPIDCILKAVTAAQHDRLRWQIDVYKPSET